ncbi:MAG TPA: DUF2304 domain-containing protein [Bryobacteraceae bacterium]|mgnify:CR=1 FL=1|nr:DUF2304 domain-containing protein [Bryobacteraceae bacterium]HOL72316.1 DUF2304 domain-containing protein [Bryobacteraceae bacterium]HOQ47596.1 DUF2304 domain-containing protein [Bryobacteraceae bacterium]HPQ16783.1 DUF2304 domain-containing protein [Bryobacteraceae bacterium]HPU73453.1 DUF2304 domain-containing protein [Bryobacteraceae bacterium]
MDGLMNFLTGLSLVLIALVLFSVRRSHIRVEYSVSWLGAALTLLVVSRSEALMNRAAAILGLTTAPLALLTLVGCVFLIVLFRLSVLISALKDANIALAQRVAVLEFHLRSLNEKIQTR